ncbi:MAG TPA: AMP-binding protein [Verrucomicrobiales bacterium]|nr:AMP-binding protein [Verrucomicrobiales bacterium]
MSTYFADTTVESGSIWTSRAPAVFIDPRRTVPQRAGLEALLREDATIQGFLLFATSGSTGGLRFACLTREALLASARSVNTSLGAQPDDHWFIAVPTWHVGGFSIFARARLSGSRVSSFRDSWEPRRFRDALAAAQSTLCSLVPTQIYDLVRFQCRSPRHLRVLLAGGAALDPRLHEQALQLGWPVRATFGMTETASQIAAQRRSAVEAPLLVLDGWQVREGPDALLEVRGPALFSGCLELDPANRWRFQPGPADSAWFTTADHVRLTAADQETSLQFLGRSAARLKIKGELVQLDCLRLRWTALAPEAGNSSVLTARKHPRDGWEIVVALEPDCPALNNAVAAFNAQVTGCERIRALCPVPSIPRTFLGKTDESALHLLVDDGRERSDGKTN